MIAGRNRPRSFFRSSGTQQVGGHVLEGPFVKAINKGRAVGARYRPEMGQ